MKGHHASGSAATSWLCPQVAVAFTKRDPIRTHARDELGIDVDELANPLQVLPTQSRGLLDPKVPGFLHASAYVCPCRKAPQPFGQCALSNMQTMCRCRCVCALTCLRVYSLKV